MALASEPWLAMFPCSLASARMQLAHLSKRPGLNSVFFLVVGMIAPIFAQENCEYERCPSTTSECDLVGTYAGDLEISRPASTGPYAPSEFGRGGARHTSWYGVSTTDSCQGFAPPARHETSQRHWLEGLGLQAKALEVPQGTDRAPVTCPPRPLPTQNPFPFQQKFESLFSHPYARGHPSIQRVASLL